MSFPFLRRSWWLIIGLLVGLPACVSAQNKITAQIILTNATVNGLTFTVNGDTRTFTNNVVHSDTQVLTNADVTGCGSKTNLLLQIYGTPFSQVRTEDRGSNSFNLVGNSGLAMSVSVSGTYATVSYSTQQVYSLTALTVPIAGLPTAAARTNEASAIVAGINQAENTNSIDQNSLAASQLVGTNNTQTIPGQKSLSNTNNHIFGIISSLGISGNSVLLTNGLYLTPILLNPTVSNGVNYGEAFSSPGSGSLSEQFGFGSQATNDSSTAIGGGLGAAAWGQNSVAVGVSAVARGDNTVAIGGSGETRADNAIAVGSGATGWGTNSTAVGTGSFASTNNSTALGVSASATFQNSTAIGYLAATTTSNQVMLGSSGSSVVVPSSLSVSTNETIGGNLSVSGNVNLGGLLTNANLTGRSIFTNSLIAFGHVSNSSLANGVNAGIIIGTNTVIFVSGPTGPFTNCGFAAGIDGQTVWIKNKTGQTMVFANQNGLEPTVANRIRTGTGSDLAITSNPGYVMIQYDGTDSRWDVVAHN